MFIYSCGIILILFDIYLFHVVRDDGMVGVLSVTTLGDSTVILCYTLGGAGVSTLGGAGSLKLCVGALCNTLGCALCLFRRY